MTVTRLITAALVLAACPVQAAAQETNATLTINDRTPLKVRSAAAVRRALQACTIRKPCANLSIETCDRCWIVAEWSGRGYVVVMRHGPPADMSVAMRARDKVALALAPKAFDTEKHASRFSLNEVTAMFANYIDDGRGLQRVTWKDIGSPLDQTQ